MIIFPNHFAGDTTKGTLIVKFIGLKSNIGEVKVALCNSSKNYDDQKSPSNGKDILIENKTNI